MVQAKYLKIPKTINDEKIKALAEAINRYLDWQDRSFQLNEERRQEGFRQAYKRKLRKQIDQEMESIREPVIPWDSYKLIEIK